MKKKKYHNKNNNRPIGVFDSGLGGLTVVKQIKKLLPNEDIVYLGDTARVPYGTRSKEIVTKFSLDDARFLLSKNVKIIIIACNTASAFAAQSLKDTLNVPVFEVISGASKKAVEVSETNKIGIIGTRGTVNSGAYKKSILKVNNKSEVLSVACPLFVPFIEEGVVESKALDMIAAEYLSVLDKAGVDTLVLGCTHYPIIKGTIAKVLGNKKINLIDPGVVEAENVLLFLSKNNMLNIQKRNGKIEYFVTDLTERFKKVAEMFLGAKILGSLKKVSLG